ncbi:hypothetical protein [uncultured Sunxiuqinia sp.]|uniref:hypothetical protein n=1 Tax=uncultured Sunxiuqinia sp. TaxID=1573825 RepID=UPI002AA69843|nr:hypothetical protein [uncultured Sunxiuqinia sp.]
MNDRLLFLLKFGNKDNVLDLYENGTLYMNSFEYFEKQEKNMYRGDSLEGVVHLENYTDKSEFTVTMEDLTTGKKISRKPQKLTMQYKDLSAGHLYCIYCIRESDLKQGERFRISTKMKDFGTHFLLIFNTHKFMDKVETCFQENKISFMARPVEYYDQNNYNGSLSLFHKKHDLVISATCIGRYR